MEELEPVPITDLLFEEYAVTFSDHDKIMETKYRRKQAKQLLEILGRNNDDCFHRFLDILQREEKYHIICKQLGNPKKIIVEDKMSYKTYKSCKHERVGEPGNTSNFFNFV